MIDKLKISKFIDEVLDINLLLNQLLWLLKFLENEKKNHSSLKPLLQLSALKNKL